MLILFAGRVSERLVIASDRAGKSTKGYGEPLRELGGPQKELRGPQKKLGGPHRDLGGPKLELRGPWRREEGGKKEKIEIIENMGL